MNALFQVSPRVNLKEVFFTLYLVAMLALTFVFVVEAKLYFEFDIAGVDLPVDEWYVNTF